MKYIVILISFMSATIFGCANVETKHTQPINMQQLGFIAMNVYMSDLYQCELVSVPCIRDDEECADDPEYEAVCTFIGTAEQYHARFFAIATAIGVNAQAELVTKPNKKYKQLAVTTTDGVVYVDPETGIW